MSETTPILTDVEQNFPDFLRDESRRTGNADSISFPKTEADIVEHLSRLHTTGAAVTVQGARTGIAAGAVPEGGHILNLSRMTRILRLRWDDMEQAFFVTVQPGVLLSELRTVLSKFEFEDVEILGDRRPTVDAPWFFPPDPTETGAALGGMAACNASGARTFFYGPTRRYIQAARVVLADGSILALRRGDPRATGRAFRVTTLAGRTIEGSLPSYRMPSVKNASGYYAEDAMDLLDVFIGSEGTLGVFSELELRLVPSPKVWWGIMTFFPEEAGALRFVQAVRAEPAKPVAIEFFDRGALALLRDQKASNPAFADLPGLDARWSTAVYVEYHGETEAAVEDAVMRMSELMVEHGGDEDATWLSSDEHDMERLKRFRHAVPEAVNLTLDQRRKREPGLTKLGTDLAVPDDGLEKVFAMYHAGLARTGLEFVMFGHVGNNHVHVNILPNTMDDYARGKALYLEWAHDVVAMGGTVSAEHGVGKLKVALLREMYGDDGIRQMRELKRAFDPGNRLAPGNLFPP